MSTGFWIFASSLVLCVTAIYITRVHATQPDQAVTALRRRRRRIVLASAVLLVVLGYAAFAAIRWWQDRPRKEALYEAVNLGMSMQEVLYLKGKPSYLGKAVEAEQAAPPLLVAAELQATDNVFNYPRWIYGDDYLGEHVTVEFDKKGGQIAAIRCVHPRIDGDLSTSACPSLSGILIGTSESNLKDRLGAPSAENLADGIKEVEFNEFQARFILFKQHVCLLELKTPQWKDTHNSLTIPVRDASSRSPKVERSDGKPKDALAQLLDGSREPVDTTSNGQQPDKLTAMLQASIEARLRPACED